LFFGEIQCPDDWERDNSDEDIGQDVEASVEKPTHKSDTTRQSIEPAVLPDRNSDVPNVRALRLPTLLPLRVPPSRHRPANEYGGEDPPHDVEDTEEDHRVTGDLEVANMSEYAQVLPQNRQFCETLRACIRSISKRFFRKSREEIQESIWLDPRFPSLTSQADCRYTIQVVPYLPLPEARPSQAQTNVMENPRFDLP
jgi:hypothetical protein